MIMLQEILKEPAEEFPASRQEYTFYRAVQVGFAGIILSYVMFHIASRYVQFASLSPVFQLIIGQIPFVVCGTGGALLGLRKNLQEHGWRKVLDMPAALPCTKRLFYGNLLKWTLVLVSCSILLTAFATFLLKAAGFQNFPRQLLEKYGTEGGLSFWIVACISAVVIAPVTEEILFRRILYQSLKGLKFAHAGMLTAFLFSLGHALPQAFVSYLFFSLVLQKACHKGSLWLAIGLHAGYNLIVLAMLMGKIFFFSAGS